MIISIETVASQSRDSNCFTQVRIWEIVNFDFMGTPSYAVFGAPCARGKCSDQPLPRAGLWDQSLNHGNCVAPRDFVSANWIQSALFNSYRNIGAKSYGFGRISL